MFISRRKVLHAGMAGMGALAIASVLSGQQEEAAAGARSVAKSSEVLERLETHLVSLSTKDMAVEFDLSTGRLTSLKRRSDRLALNYVSNAKNTPPRDEAITHRVGDLTLTTWLLQGEWSPQDSVDPGASSRRPGRWRQSFTGPFG